MKSILFDERQYNDEKDKQETTIGGFWVAGKYVGMYPMRGGKKFIKCRNQLNKKDICPVCKERFTEENTKKIVLFISAPICPNHIVHKECLGNNPQELFETIQVDYYENKK